MSDYSNNKQKGTITQALWHSPVIQVASLQVSAALRIGGQQFRRSAT